MLPHALLNRTNKELKQKIDDLEGRLANQRATVLLEKEVFSATQVQVKEAKDKLLTVKRLEEAARKRAERASEEAAQVKSEAARAKQVYSALTIQHGDVMSKFREVEQRVETSRRKLEIAQHNARDAEAQAMQWFEENKLTGNATSAATSIFEDQSQEIQKKRREGERFMNLINTVQQQLNAEEQSYSKYMLDYQDAVEAIAQYKNDMVKVQHDQAELERRGEELGEVESDRKDRKAHVTDSLKKRQEEVNQLKIAAREEEQRVEKTTREHSRGIDLMNRLAHQVVQHQSSVNHESALARGELSKLQVEKQKQKAILADIAQLKEKLVNVSKTYEAAVARYEAIEAKASEVDEQSSEFDETESLEVVRRELVGRLDDVNRLIERGMAAIQQQTTAQVQEAKSTESVSKEVVYFRQQMHKAQSSINDLNKKFASYEETAAAIDVNIDAVSDKIAQAEAQREKSGAEARRRLQEEVQILREELAELERIGRQLLRCTTNANTSAVVAKKDSEGTFEEIERLQSDMQALKMEIKAREHEMETLFVERSRMAGVVEELETKIDSLSIAAGAKGEKALEEYAVRLHLEKQIKAVAQDTSALEALRGDLRAAEHERHTLQKKLNAENGRMETLHSRYDHMMDALRMQCAADAASPILDSNSKNTDTKSGGSGARVGEAFAEMKDSLLSPEEIEARMIVQRTMQREELQKRGDSLDRAIVRGEADLQTLNGAIDLMRMTADTARSAGAIEDEETTLLIDDLRSRYLEQQPSLGSEDTARKELAYWTSECSRHSDALVRERNKLQLLQNQLSELLATQDTVRQELRVLQRQKTEMDRQLAGEEQHHAKVRNVLRVKQQNVFSKPQAGVLVHHAEQATLVENVFSQLRSLVIQQSKPNPKLYFAFRDAMDRYVPADLFPVVPSAPTAMRAGDQQSKVSQGKGAHPSAQPPPSASASSHLPGGGSGSTSSPLSQVIHGGSPLATTSIEFKGRSASRALVEAIAQRPLATAPKRSASTSSTGRPMSKRSNARDGGLLSVTNSRNGRAPSSGGSSRRVF